MLRLLASPISSWPPEMRVSFEFVCVFECVFGWVECMLKWKVVNWTFFLSLTLHLLLLASFLYFCGQFVLCLRSALFAVVAPATFPLFFSLSFYGCPRVHTIYVCTHVRGSGIWIPEFGKGVGIWLWTGAICYLSLCKLKLSRIKLAKLFIAININQPAIPYYP